MLSIDDVKNVSFRRANFGGYRPEDVDAFVDDVELSYSELLAEKKRLLFEIDHLNKKIEKLYCEDDAIKNIILNAQMVAESSLSEAEKKTSEMIDAAARESDEMIKKAKREVEFQNDISNKIKAESMSLKKKLNDIYEEHLKIIDKIPETPVDDDVFKKSTKEVEKSASNNQLTESEPVFAGREKKMDDISSGTQSFEVEKKSMNEELFGTKDFKDLKFGKSYDVSKDESTSGAYFGLFKRKK